MSSPSPAETGPTGGKAMFKARAVTAALIVSVFLVAGPAAAQTGVTELTSGDSGIGLGRRTAVTLGGVLYFPWCGAQGCELWRSNGTAAGTSLVRDIEPGIASSTPSGLTVVGSTLYFAAYDSTNGRELWRSDGTQAGTVLVRNIASGATSSSPNHLVAFGSTLIFAAYESATFGTELWSSTGTSAGTTRVADVYTGGTSSSPEELTVAGGFVYFSAEHGTYGRELWRTNGTAAGTVIVSDIVPGVGWSEPRHLTAFGSALILVAHTSATGNELYRTDGLNTFLVKDVFPGSGSSDPAEIVVFGSTLYFSAKDASSGTELWRSDGTDLGTLRVKDLRPGIAGSQPRGLTASGSTLFFGADDGASGRELWKSDGTEAGTALVKDLWTGSSPSSPAGFEPTPWGVVFQARGTEGGSGLYRSNGTSNGTWLIGSTATTLFGEVDQTAPFGGGLVVSAFSTVTAFNRLTFLSDQGLLASTTPRLVNLSTRGLVGTGDNILIGGFIVGGSGSKRVIIRGRGPSMASFGVAGTLSDPAIRLFNGATPVEFNDNWQTAGNASELTASGHAPAFASEAALLTTVDSNIPYTVHVTGTNNSAGIGIVEIFELDKPEIPLLNISTRGPVLTGDTILIGGFIIQGEAPQQVLITAKGPSLGLSPFHLAGSLPDPRLELYSGSTVIESNDNWGESPNLAAIQNSGNAPTNPLESAIIRTLAPGSYTAIVRGVGAFQGIGLVEVYRK